MSAVHVCVADSPRAAGYRDRCHICGIPVDASYFDAASIKPAPAHSGDTVEAAAYQLNPQYCGVLLYFAQYAEPKTPGANDDPLPVQGLFETPGYEWVILSDSQPLDPYLPFRFIRNAWGQNAFPLNLRLREGSLIRFVVRRVSPVAGPADVKLLRVGGRLFGRAWYNTTYGSGSSGT